jgi:excisionase family DNA binding protein
MPLYIKPHWLRSIATTGGLGMMKKGDSNESELLRIPEFSAALSIKEATTRDWVLRRRIDVVRIGRSVRIPRSEVTRIQEEGFTPRHE